MRSESIIAVQTLLAGGKEAELRFRASSMRQDDGALSLWDRPDPDGPERMIMAFAPAAWRGAWVVDPSTSYPVGLELDSAPSSRPASPLREAPARAAPSPAPAAAPSQPPVFAAPSAEPAWPESYQPAASVDAANSAPSPLPGPASAAGPGAPAEAAPAGAEASPPAWEALERDARMDLVANALLQAPYEGLPALAERLGAPAEEVEQALAAALALRKADPQLVQDPALQTLMDQVNPELIRTHRPKKPAEILELLRQRDDTAAVDLVQLRVWLLRNPPKRPA